MSGLTIATWNINSVRLRAPLIANFAEQADPDAICLQEIKCQEDQFPYKAFAKMGYPYELLKEWNPNIIYASNGGFGPKGDWAFRGSFDAVAQGFSGWMVSQGGGPDHPPCQSPFGLGDQVGAMCECSNGRLGL